jgi:chromosome segregation protein
LELIARDIRQNGQKRERAELEAAQLLDNIGDIEKERKSIEDVQSGIEEGSAATQEDVQRSQARLSELRAQYEADTSALTERKVQRMALQKEEDAARTEHTRLMKERAHTARAMEENQAAQERAAAQETALQAQLEELLSGVGVEQTAVNERKEQQHALEEERQRRQQALSEARAQKDELNARVRELEERRHKQELAQSRMELEFEAMRERMQADYELTYEEALPLRTELGGVTAAHVRIDELKKAIRELGSINVNAVEDFKILNGRYETLNAQCDDLTRAEADLQTLIAELTTTMERQFLREFQIIHKNFSEVFEQLFGGGWAELRLSDPRMCSTAISISSRSRGKKLQLLTLLSGGERRLRQLRCCRYAQTQAYGVLYTRRNRILAREVNVTRFANYLREYSDDTQFILITHRKGSMEVCNALYGVAMEEKGVSKIVSAQFQDAAS